jgi:hypothetical protein
MKSTDTNNDSIEARTARNGVRLCIWTISWVLTVALMAFGPKFLWDFNNLATAIAIGINLLMGYKMILVNKDHLLGLDELQQRIQLNAMAISLGAGLVLGTTYDTLEDIKVITFESEIAHLIIAMSIVYIVSILIGNRRYA